MTDKQTTTDEIEEVAGTEDDQGVIQPELDEILDPDPEEATDDEIAALDDEELDGDELDDDA